VVGKFSNNGGMERIVGNIKEEFKMWEIAYAGGCSTLA
jgi:hypothetical protein